MSGCSEGRKPTSCGATTRWRSASKSKTRPHSNVAEPEKPCASTSGGPSPFS